MLENDGFRTLPALGAPVSGRVPGAALFAGVYALLAALVQPGRLWAAEGTAAASAAPVPEAATAAAPVDQTIDQAGEHAEARDSSLLPRTSKPWQVLGEVQYRALLVTDPDPANDRHMLYRLQGVYSPAPALHLSARIGLDQNFVSVPDESGFRFEDLVLGASTEHSVSLAPWHWDRSVGLNHRFRLYLPTSRTSQHEDLYFAAELGSRARLRVVDQLFVGLGAVLNYRMHQYAEQAGPGGEPLPRLIAQALAFVEYSPLVSKQYGTVSVGGDLFGDETVNYATRDPGSISVSQLPPGTLSESGAIAESGHGNTFVTPHYGYDLYVAYLPPIQNFTFSASIEQAGSVLQYGEPRLFFINRDQTEFVLRVTASY